jgi:murein DD-endopeptidase MepM/ murein hydrolase activator NlpD
MYGHLDYALAVSEGQDVTVGQPLGSVLLRTDGTAPSHLHFEIRTFLTTPEVNGTQPRYGFACGYNCAPGPGYWPIDAPEHPSAMGWRNPTHVIAKRSQAGNDAVVADGINETVPVWSLPSDRADAEQIGEVPLRTGDQFTWSSTAAGPEVTSGWSAERYRLWYEVELPALGSGWIQAAVPSDIETGGDGRASAIVPRLLPV